MKKIYEDVIFETLHELSNKHAKYQALYFTYHGKEDEDAKHVHFTLVQTLERVLKEIESRERK